MIDRPTEIRVTETPGREVSVGRIYAVLSWHGSFPKVWNDSGHPVIIYQSKWEPVAPASGAAASAILAEATAIVGGARNATHGDKERSFGVIADLWNGYLDGRKAPGPISSRDVAACMVLLKLARSVQGTPDRDHFLDAAGYAAIAGELAACE